MKSENKIEPGALAEELRALLASPQLGVPDYAADPLVARRVGKLLYEAVSAGPPRRDQGDFL